MGRGMFPVYTGLVRYTLRRDTMGKGIYVKINALKEDRLMRGLYMNASWVHAEGRYSWRGVIVEGDGLCRKGNSIP